jgi:hypothetical protein
MCLHASEIYLRSIAGRYIPEGNEAAIPKYVSQKSAKRLNPNLRILWLTVCSNTHTRGLVPFRRDAHFPMR